MDPVEQTLPGVAPFDLGRRVEEASINAWPAMQQMLFDGWLLRFARGFTKRANSVIPLYGGEVPLPEKVRFCENLYARERLKTIFRLTSLGEHQALDEFLERRGYRHLDPSDVLILSLDQRPLPSPELCLLPAERWLDAYCALTGMPDHARSLHAAILHGIPLPCAYIVLGPPDSPLACGLAVLEQDLVGLFDVVTRADVRRRGAGTALVRSLLAWAWDQGARRAYLQVVADNEPAQRLYQRLGFTSLYRYWYRVSG